jgi:hypothetical protein
MNNFDATFMCFVDDKLGKTTGWNGHSLTLSFHHRMNDKSCRGNLVGLTTRYRLDDSGFKPRRRENFSLSHAHPDKIGTHTASCKTGTRALSQALSYQGVTLTINCHLVPRL